MERVTLAVFEGLKGSESLFRQSWRFRDFLAVLLRRHDLEPAKSLSMGACTISKRPAILIMCL